MADIGSTQSDQLGRRATAETPDNNRYKFLAVRPRRVVELGTCHWPGPLAIARETCVCGSGNHTCKQRRAAETSTRRQRRGNKSYGTSA